MKGVPNLSDDDLLRIWRRQAFDMGVVDAPIPVKPPGDFGLSLRERKRIIREAELAGLSNPFRRFREQQRAAACRGIEWDMTFQEWWALWEPYWKQRGHRGHGLEMCRKGDCGPYSVGNVFIASGLENREMTRGRRRLNKVSG